MNKEITKFELPKYCKATETSLTFSDDTPYEVWEEVGKNLKVFGGAIQLWLGDWLNFGEKRYGNKYTKALEETSYELKTLQNFATVAGRTEETRNKYPTSGSLSMGHWDSIASIAKKLQEFVLVNWKILIDKMGISEKGWGITLFVKLNWEDLLFTGVAKRLI